MAHKKITMRFLPLALCLALAACAAAPVPLPDAAVVQPVESQPPLTGRAALRNFGAVVGAVGPVAENMCRQRAPQRNCDFRIVVDDRPGQQANAYQSVDSSGRPMIAFTLSLIAEVRNADELAFVMAHEAAHHIQGHLERQQRNATVGALIFGELAGVFGDGSVAAIQSAQQMGASVGARTYSKEFELEADALGTQIAAAAGFSPLKGAEFFFRIPDPGDRFLGTHPANADRLRTVQRVAAGL
ncbi:M48 family metallopeptidase [Yoonia sp.]|uniref:M48 family metallopeptidase n=1 Tax=Yoonia sp. TaxID=2212373 RepID=UPI0025E24C3E|nr:M48 family metallopeptidase [Yoonia sp.]